MELDILPCYEISRGIAKILFEGRVQPLYMCVFVCVCIYTHTN